MPFNAQATLGKLDADIHTGICVGFNKKCSSLQVLSVVKEQISRALEIQPGTFDQFRNKLQHLTYAEITNIWQQERRHKEEFESQARPIV